MDAEATGASALQIAHVLFADIVGYSVRPMEEQTRLVRELQELIRGTPEFRRAQAGGALICMPTGDGAVLAFLQDPLAPVQCAIQLARMLRRRPDLQLRIGVHSGPVYVVEDINRNRNVAGSGVNLAQRVMDCGDAGHILLSSAAAELLCQLGAWPLEDLGQVEVKHGERLHLFNLHGDEFGNPAVPTKLAQTAPTALWPAASSPAALGKVVLLYQRYVQPDERLLLLLEARLAEHGYDVFIDRHLRLGMEWVQAIEQHIRTADAVVALISQTSIQSEMLACELEIAHEEAQRQGRPRILPVRIGYEGPLPDPLAAILDPLHYTVWEGEKDDQRLVEKVLEGLQAPPATAPERVPVSPPSPMPPLELEAVGGAVPLHSRFYVVRSADAEFLSAIARRDSIVLVKGARQMGKTSLLARGLQQARDAGDQVVRTDFQKLNASHLASVETFLMALAQSLADQLDLDVLPDEEWNPRRGPNMNFERYLRRHVLSRGSTHLVWGLDEVDRLFPCDFGSEVFGLFRSWHNERSLDPTGPWSCLTLAIAYATEAHFFIRDVNQSPFNVGTRVTLEDFTFEQVGDLNRRYGLPLRNEAEVARFVHLVGGHPYLVRRGLHEMVTRGLDIAAFEERAATDEGPFGDHLRRILVLLSRDDELREEMREILRGQPCRSPESFYRLRSAGLMAGDSPREIRPRCQLYATYLKQHLL